MMNTNLTHKRIIVTGGAGFIGSHLVDALIGAGHSVLVVDDFSTGDVRNINPAAEFREMNILRPRLDEVFSAFSPDLVFHLAAAASINSSLNDPAITSTVNYVGAVNVFEAARKAKARRIVFSSSCAVYGKPDYLPVDGAHSIKPVSPYGVDKFAAEEYLRFLHRKYDQDYAIVRFSNIYGPRQCPVHGGLVARFCKALAAGERPVIDGDGEQKRDFLYVSDAVNALVLSGLSSERARCFNVGTGNGTSVNEVCRILVQQYKPGGLIAEYRANVDCGVKDIRLSHGRAHIALGWSPKVKIDEGLKITAKSYQKEVKSYA